MIWNRRKTNSRQRGTLNPILIILPQEIILEGHGVTDHPPPPIQKLTYVSKDMIRDPSGSRGTRLPLVHKMRFEASLAKRITEEVRRKLGEEQIMGSVKDIF